MLITRTKGCNMKIIPIPCLFDNYSYLVLNIDTQEAIVVDPGEAYPILVEVEKLGVNLTAVLCTHHHNDHVGGVSELVTLLPELDVYGFIGEQNRINMLNKLLSDGDQFSVGGVVVTTLHTPGHTTGSVCYHIGDCLLTGDTLFGGGVGRLFEGTAAEMYSSIQKKILQLSVNTHLFFGHEYTLTNLGFAQTIEPENNDITLRINEVERNLGKGLVPSTIEIELATNPFFRCDQPEIIKSLKDKALIDGDSAPEVFKAIRLLRDVYKD